MIGSRLIKSNDVAAGCEDIVDNYDPFGEKGYLEIKAKIFLDHAAGRTDTEISYDLKRPRNKSFRENRTRIVQEQIEDMGKQLLDFMHYTAYFKIQEMICY